MKEENKKPEGKKKYYSNAWQYLFYFFIAFSFLTINQMDFVKLSESAGGFVGEIIGYILLPALCFFLGYIRPKYIQKKEINSIVFYSAIILFCILIFKIILVVYTL